MRITFISPPASLAGGFKVIVIHAQNLMQMGHTVCIVSPPPRKDRASRKIKRWLRGYGWSNELASARSHLEGTDVRHSVLDCWRPVMDSDVPDADVVVATWWETAEWVHTLSASKGAKVYFIQGHEIWPPLPIARTRATYGLPFHKIVVSRWLKQIMSTEYGDDVVDVVPNSVDRRHFFAPVRGKQQVGTVGLLYATAQVKGVDVALSAIKSVQKKTPDLRVLSFGNERPTPQLALPASSEFFFFVSPHQIRDIYTQCDVWISASRSEGFNLTAMEAMACRTPIVATRTGWPQEAIQSGRNGILVDIDDEKGLEEGIQWVLSQSDQNWRQLSANAYATAASGSWEASAKMFEKALQHACCRSARGEIAGTCADASLRVTSVR
jgi:glycosyltransferase involved in cell wall biosynthesis